MKKRIRKFIINCMCDAIQLYMSKHRFGFNGMLELLPLTHDEFEDHILRVFQGNKTAAIDYLGTTTPIAHPQSAQITK